MRNFKILLFLKTVLFFSSVSINAGEIDVELSTKNLQKTVFVKEAFKYSNFEEGYRNKILDVLHFDLKNNGYCKIIDAQNDALFEIVLNYSKNSLNITATNKNSKLKPLTKSYLLFGDLCLDRKKIHNFNDEFLNYFLQKTGIATKKILFCLKTSKKEKNKIKYFSDIWMSDYDGKNKIKITENFGYCITPFFVPKKEKIKKVLFTSYKNGQPKLFVLSLNNPQKAVELIKLRGNQMLPSISQSADKIAFISDAAGRPDLFLQNFKKSGYLDGRPYQLFSKARATQASPSISPNGEEIAFVSDKDGPPRIYLLKIPSRNTFYKRRPQALLLTKKNRVNVSPCFSCDGKFLAYSAKTDGTRQIWIYDFEKKTEQQLTFDKKNKENPHWAKDNLHIIYNTEDNNVAEIYIIDTNNRKPVKISQGIGMKRFPSWEF
jgi:TolB protein